MQDVDNLPEEVWEDIPGYEGKYKVSNMGRAYNLMDSKLMNLTAKNTINVRDPHKEFSMKILVYKLFVDRSYNKGQIDFIDGDSNNLRFSNLKRHTLRSNLIDSLIGHYKIMDITSERTSKGQFKYLYYLQCINCKKKFKASILHEVYKCDCFYTANKGDILLNKYKVLDKYYIEKLYKGKIERHYAYKIQCLDCKDILDIKYLNLSPSSKKKGFNCSCYKSRTYIVGNVYKNLLILDKKNTGGCYKNGNYINGSESYKVKCLSCGDVKWIKANVLLYYNGFKCSCKAAVTYKVGDIVRKHYKVIKVHTNTGHGNRYNLECIQCHKHLYNKPIPTRAKMMHTYYLCGCSGDSPLYIDGRSKEPLYRLWQGMISRGKAKDIKTYQDIFVIKYWNTYNNFKSWWTINTKNYSIDNYNIPDYIKNASNPSVKKLLSPSIDRIDPRYEYAPYNCQIIPTYINGTTKRVNDQNRTPIQLKIDALKFNRRKNNWIKQMKKQGYREEELI